MLIIDEADRILEQGFEEDMHQIIKVLPKQRQTVLFSATQTKKVNDGDRASPCLACLATPRRATPPRHASPRTPHRATPRHTT